MKMKTLLLLFPLVEAFVVLPSHRQHVSLVVLHETSDYDDTLARIQREYKELQETLLKDLVVKHDKVDAEEVAEEMMEKLVDATAVQRYKQMEIMDQAEKEMAQAEDDESRARSLKDQVHGEATMAEHEAMLLESFDNEYKDQERLRDMALAHADEELELDAEVLELQSEYHKEMAEKKEQEAARLLKKLQDYEARLKESLQDMRAMKNEKAAEERKKQETEKHELFLEKIKASIDNDSYLASSMHLEQTEATRNEMPTKELKNRQVDKIEASIDNDPYLSA